MRNAGDWFAPLVVVMALGTVLPQTLGSEPPVRGMPPAGQTAGAAAALPVEAQDAACDSTLSGLKGTLDLKLPIPIAQSLVLTLPDPVSTPAAAVFDAQVEASVSALASLGYVRDRFYFPWAQSTANKQPQCPGMMLFRHKKQKPLVVLIVGESSTEGINGAMLEHALKLLATGKDPLRILGPYYSATAESLKRTLWARKKRKALRFRIASGSLSVDTEAATVRKLAPDFRSFASTTSERKQSVLEFLGHENEHQSIGLLQESGTVYGRGQASKDDAPVFAIEYPPNVSALRDAYASLERAGSGKEMAQRTDLPAAIDRRVHARDMVPTFALEQSVVAHDLALRDLAARLDELRIGDAIVTGVLTQDLIFLTRRLKRMNPDLRPVFYYMDRLYTHSDFAADLRGSIVVTSYASLRNEATHHTTLSRDTAHGLYDALRWLFGEPVEVEPTVIGVISNRKLWPLELPKTTAGAQAPFKALKVPGSFWFLSAVAIGLALLNSLLIMRVPRTSTKHASKQKRWLYRWLRRIETQPVGRSRAWFLAGLQPCVDEIVRPWHSLMASVSQAALVGIMLILGLTWCMAGQAASGRSSIDEAMRFSFSIGFVIAALIGTVILAQKLRETWNLLQLSRSAHSRDPEDVDPVERSLRRRTRNWARAMAAVLLVAIVLITTLTIIGFASVEGSQRVPFLDRALHLSSGVSPIVVPLLSLAFLYLVALTHASRLRILDLGSEKVGDRLRRYALSRAGDDDSELLERERALYEGALLPGGIRFVVGVVVALLLPLMLVVHVRPSAWTRLHDFTLESAWLSAAMALGLLTCLGATVVSTFQLLRLYRQLSELLRALSASDLGDSFTKMPRPIQRTVAELLALGPQDATELQVVLRALSPAEPGASLPGVATPRMRSSLPSTKEFSDVLTAATKARQDLSSRAIQDPQDRARLRHGLATYVAFGLTRWVKQFRFLMTLATAGIAGLLIASSLYVFSVRRLLITMFVVLTVAVVATGAWVFAGLERDRVLSCIGRTTPGKITFQDSAFRIFSWGVLPVVLALASYYPDAVRQLLVWTSALGSAR